MNSNLKIKIKKYVSKLKNSIEYYINNIRKKKKN